MRTKLVILLTGAALMFLTFGCSVDKPTQSDPSPALLRPTGVLQAPGIGDLVWLDANKNGLQDSPAEEPGLSGITVQLLTCADSTVIASETTDSAGLYGFDELTPGDYFIHFVLPEGYAFSPMDVGTNDSIDSDADTLTGYTDCISIDSGEIDLTWDAGMYPLPPVEAAVGDFVWEDLNHNGLQDEGEPGIGGVDVRLVSCDDTLMAERETMTDTLGYYRFNDVMPGNYRLHFDLPDGYTFTLMDVGDNDSTDSDVDPLTGYTECIHLDSGAVDLTWDAGMYLLPSPATIGDFVWDDVNMNGIQDEGEPGMPGIEVILASCAVTDSVMAERSTITDSTGHYTFTDVPAGEYVLYFNLPFGYLFSPMDVGTNDSIDSDVDTATGYTACITLDTGQVDLTWDAGMYPSTGGCTYSKGYWKTHAGFGPQPDVVTPLLPIWLGAEGGDKSLEVATARMAVDILQQQTCGHPWNGITKLYAQLLTAKLNIADGAGAADIIDVISKADTFLAMYDWTDWRNLSKSQMHLVLKWKDKLGAYNDGKIGPGQCGEDHNCDHHDHYNRWNRGHHRPYGYGHDGNHRRGGDGH